MQHISENRIITFKMQSTSILQQSCYCMKEIIFQMYIWTCLNSWLCIFL